MSNYRVRQVLALGPMPDRQLRLLVALATWMGDDSLTVRVGFGMLTGDMGTSADTARRARRDAREAGRISYVPGRGRGHVTLWIIHCLPAKGEQDAAPLSGDVKGEQRPPEKGGNLAHKRGAAHRADQQDPEHGLDLPAKPSSSLSRIAEAILAAVPDATEREIRSILDTAQADPKIRNAIPWLTAAVANGDAPALVAEARYRLAEHDAMGKMLTGTAPARLDWCGQCSDPRTRQIEIDGRVARCPDCHPKARQSTTNGRVQQAVEAGRRVQAMLNGEREHQDDAVPLGAIIAGVAERMGPQDPEVAP